MHTAICAFDDRSRAEEAVASLVRAGFARHDVHIEHKHATGEGSTNRHWDGADREGVADRGALSALGHFFTSLLGRDNTSGHVDRYSQHVERGSYVVVVDGRDEADAQRARAVLHEMRGNDLDVVHRPEHRPLRDIVGMRGEDAKAGMVERSRETYEGWSSSGSALRGDRAMASNAVSPTTGPDLREPELDRPPGLRYADNDDKPI